MSQEYEAAAEENKNFSAMTAVNNNNKTWINKLDNTGHKTTYHH